VPVGLVEVDIDTAVICATLVLAMARSSQGQARTLEWKLTGKYSASIEAGLVQRQLVMLLAICWWDIFLRSQVHSHIGQWSGGGGRMARLA
jgi:hypothetical protein